MNTVTQIKNELLERANPEHVKGAERFFIEPIKTYGVSTPVVRKLSQAYYQSVKAQAKGEVFEMCEELLKSDYNEEATIAFDWAFRQKKNYVKDDFKVFENWLYKYINNWAKCDDFCTHAFGHLFFLFPGLYKDVKVWTKSDNKWVRRASAVIFIYPNRKVNKLEEIFEIAGLLMDDSEDLVQKAYGWMLKEASNIYQKETFNFVMENKNKMTRTALRYAIEKMPKDLKKHAME